MVVIKAITCVANVGFYKHVRCIDYYVQLSLAKRTYLPRPKLVFHNLPDTLPPRLCIFLCIERVQPSILFPIVSLNHKSPLTPFRNRITYLDLNIFRINLLILIYPLQNIMPSISQIFTIQLTLPCPSKPQFLIAPRS